MNAFCIGEFGSYCTFVFCDRCGGRGGSDGGDSFRNCSSCGRHTLKLTTFGAVRKTSSASYLNDVRIYIVSTIQSKKKENDIA